MSATRRALPTFATALLLAACGAPTGSGPPVDPAAPGPLADALAAGRPITAIVVLGAPAVALEKGGDPGRRDAEQAEVYAAWKASAVSGLAGAGLQVLRSYRNLPALEVELRDPEALRALAARPEVAAVYEDAPHEPSLAETLPLVGQPAVLAAGRDGAGAAVAVLDTGVDFTRAAFGACAAAGAPGCKVIHAADFAPSDGVRDSGSHHGTNVAGIVAGVAPGATLLALDVFRADGYAYTSDLLAAMDWCVQHRATYGIVAMNLSLGGGGSTSACAGDPLAAGIAAARRAGVLAAVSSGNGGFSDRIASPACGPDALSVGAVTDADAVASFSNSASFLTFLAPGTYVSAAGITMSGTSQAAPHVAGAIAVVRGAFPAESAEDAVLRLRATGRSVTDPRNGASVPRIDLAAATSGSCVASLSTARVTLPQAGGSASVTVTTAGACAWTAATDDGWVTPSPASGTGTGTITLTAPANLGVARTTGALVAGRRLTIEQGADTAAPTGSVTIAGGEVTRAQWTWLTISASDPSGVSAMCVSNVATCTAWEPYATGKSWPLASGASGLRTVSVRFRDARGNVSAPVQDTVVYDVTAPVRGRVTATGGDATVVLAWTGYADAQSGLAGYTVVAAAGAPPASCAAGTVVYTGSASGFTHAGLANGTTYGYRVCATDAAGNQNAGATAAARPAPEYAPPAGSVTIGGGEALRSLSVTLDLPATDASGVAAMCISNRSTCTTWEPYAPSKAWALATGGSGVRRVSVWFRDPWGNVTAAPAVDTVTYDVAGPSGGAAGWSSASGAVTLWWWGVSDALSGVASYRVVAAPGRYAPASGCAAGTLVGTSTNPWIVHSGLAAGATWSYRICGVDGLGNVGSGFTRTSVVVQ